MNNVATIEMATMNSQDKLLYDLKINVLKALASVNRFRIAELLQEGELCVGDIAEKLGMEKTGISKNLSILQKAHIVKSRRDGRNTHYSLRIPCILNVFKCVETVIREQTQELASVFSRIK